MQPDNPSMLAVAIVEDWLAPVMLFSLLLNSLISSTKSMIKHASLHQDTGIQKAPSMCLLLDEPCDGFQVCTLWAG